MVERISDCERDRAESRVDDPFVRLAKEHLVPALSERRIGSDAPTILIQAHRSSKYRVASAVLGVALALEYDARIVVYRSARGSRWQYSGSRMPVLLRPLRVTEVVRPSRREDLSWAQLFADEVIEFRPRGTDLRRADALVHSYLASNPTVADLERLEFDGVNIGEALIDKFVQKGNARVDPTAPQLIAMIRDEAVRLSVLRSEVESRDVAAMVAIDVAYSPGLSLRLALSRDVDAFVAHHRQIARLTHKRPFTGLAPLDFPRFLDSVEKEARQAIREWAEEFLSQRLGPNGTGFSTTGSSVWSRSSSDFLGRLYRGERKVVLVAAHSFYDAQHSGGSFLFSDFFTWLQHLSTLSRRTNYLWLLKLHPDERDLTIGVRAAVEQLFVDQGNVVVLPSEVTQRQLIEFGVDIVHTVYGTVAMEFPYLGIAAVVARVESAHSAYDYALTPTSVQELDEILLNPEKWDYPIDRNQILENVALQNIGHQSALRSVLADAQLGETEFPWTQDWISMVTHDSFRGGIDRLRDWIASGDHSAGHWLGRRRLLEQLREGRAFADNFGS